MKYGFLLAIPLVLAGCSNTPEENFNSEAVQTNAKEADAIVKAQNDFGADLLSHFAKTQTPTENLLVSPASVWQALALTSSGARGETANQAKRLLGLQSLSDDQIGKSNRAFSALLGQQKGASLLVANSVWFSDSFKPDSAFVERAKTDFGATVNQFSSASAAESAKSINDWVSANTKNEIPRIVQDSDIQGQKVVLVNAVYFRGVWDVPFEKHQTQSAPFHLKSGGTVEVLMMNDEREAAYLNGQSFQGVRLSYKDTSCALWAMLPRKGKTASDVMRELGEAKSRKLQGSDTVRISLPRFEIECRKELKKDLSGMKAPLLFSQQADLSAMGEHTGGISAILHVCKMKVDEEGTVASAVTSANAAAGMPPVSQEPKVLKFDRPFVVALVEETSEARLFEGVVNNPNAGK